MRERRWQCGGGGAHTLVTRAVHHVWTDERGLFSVQFADAQVSSTRGVRASGSNSQVSVS